MPEAGSLTDGDYPGGTGWVAWDHAPVALQAAGTDGIVELDVAAAGVMSEGVLAATTAHLSRERALGAYEAAAEAEGVLAEGRSRLAALAEMPGSSVEFVGNGSEAVRGLVEAWPLTPGEAVLAPRSEFLTNRLALDRLTARRGTSVVELAEDGAGRLDPAAVEEAPARPPGRARRGEPRAVAARGRRSPWPM